MSDERGLIYKIRWEIVVIAVSLILSGVVMSVIQGDFSAQIIKQQKIQRQQEEAKSLRTTLQEQVGLTEESNKNMTSTNSTGTKP